MKTNNNYEIANVGNADNITEDEVLFTHIMNIRDQIDELNNNSLGVKIEMKVKCELDNQSIAKMFYAICDKKC